MRNAKQDNTDRVSSSGKETGIVLGMRSGGYALVKPQVPKVEKKRYLISGVFPGEIIEYSQSASKRGKRRKRARLQSVLWSPWSKMSPFCSHYRECGGCDLQELSYDEQLKAKQKTVVGLLSSCVEREDAMIPIIGCEKRMYYRNKVSYSFSERPWLSDKTSSGGDRRAVGFHAKRFYDKVVHVRHCFLHHSNALRRSVHLWAVENDIRYYDNRTHEGFLRSMTVRTAPPLQEGGKRQCMVIVCFAREEEEKITTLSRALLRTDPDIVSIYVVINDGRNDDVSRKPHRLIYGKPFIEEQCIHEKGRLKLKIFPRVFYQTHSWQAQELYRIIYYLSGCGADDEVLDLYCGIGSIGLYCAPYVKRVVGIESESGSVEVAKENARCNGIHNVSFFTALSEDALGDHTPRDIEAALRGITVAIVDPPRAGLHKRVIRFLREKGPPVVVYASCNPERLADDCEHLRDAYEITQYVPIDMFPHTHHVETVVRLERKERKRQ